jgi:outer membrane protein TolC
MRRLLPLLATAALAACAVGPDYRAPPIPAGAQAPLVSLNPAAETATAPPDDWWRLYNDPLLDRLIGEAFAANADLAAAEANLSAARAVLEASRAGRYPTTNVVADAIRGRDPITDEILEIDGVRPTTIWKFDALLDVSYEVDLFGRVRRSIEASRADAEAVAAARDGLRVTVAAETARAYAQVCTLGEELAVARPARTPSSTWSAPRAWSPKCAPRSRRWRGRGAPPSSSSPPSSAARPQRRRPRSRPA